MRAQTGLLNMTLAIYTSENERTAAVTALKGDRAAMCRCVMNNAMQETIPKGQNVWLASRTFLDVRNTQRRLTASVAHEHEVMRAAHASFRQVSALSSRCSPGTHFSMSSHKSQASNLLRKSGKSR